MKKLFLTIVILSGFGAFSANAAKVLVNSASAIPAASMVNLKIGDIASSATGSPDTVSNNVGTTGCVIGSGAKAIPDNCVNGSFVVNGCNSSSGSVKTKFIVFLTAIPATLSNGSSTVGVNSIKLASCNATSCTYNFSSGNGARNLTINTYGSVNIGSGQASGNYTGSYTITACSCNNAGTCPAIGSCSLYDTSTGNTSC